MSKRCARSLSVPLFPALLLGLGAAGCPTYTFVEKVPEKKKEANVVVPAAKPIPADILFIVDNSCSMEDEQENLALNFDAFIREVAGAGDYRLAIVTTDLLSEDQGRRKEFGGVTKSNFEANDPNMLTGGIDRSQCVVTDIDHGCFRGPDPSTRIITSQQTADQQQALFAANVRVGSCGSGTEQGLAGMAQALANGGQGGCNDGFLRPEANLVIVIVSDEDDASQGDVRQFVQTVAQYKSYDSVRIAAIVGAGTDGVAARCARGGATDCGGACQRFGPPQGSMISCTRDNDCQGTEVCVDDGTGNRECLDHIYQFWNFGCYWCSFYNAPDCCSALAGNRYVEFARLLEDEIAAANPNITDSGCAGPENTRIGCLVDSICQENFSRTLQRIAKDLVLTTEYTLSPPATYPPGVVVRVNGETLVYGVDYNVTDNGAKLTFTGEKTPKEGESVEIYYVIDEG